MPGVIYNRATGQSSILRLQRSSRGSAGLAGFETRANAVTYHLVSLPALTPRGNNSVCAAGHALKRERDFTKAANFHSSQGYSPRSRKRARPGPATILARYGEISQTTPNP